MYSRREVPEDVTRGGQDLEGSGGRREREETVLLPDYGDISSGAEFNRISTEYKK